MRSWKQGKGQRKRKMKDTMERAKLKSELDNLQRLVDRIPPEVLAELKRQQRTRGGKRYEQKFKLHDEK